MVSASVHPFQLAHDWLMLPTLKGVDPPFFLPFQNQNPKPKKGNNIQNLISSSPQSLQASLALLFFVFVRWWKLQTERRSYQDQHYSSSSISYLFNLWWQEVDWIIETRWQRVFYTLKRNDQVTCHTIKGWHGEDTPALPTVSNKGWVCKLYIFFAFLAHVSSFSLSAFCKSYISYIW